MRTDSDDVTIVALFVATGQPRNPSHIGSKARLSTTTNRRYYTGMKRLLIVLVAAASVAILPGSASARPVLWAGTTGTPGGEAVSGIPWQSLILSTSGGKVNVKSLQMVMNCTDTQDGLVSPIAFWATTSPRVALQANRYTLDFAASAGGRDGQVHMAGQLGSNGKGTARITMTATSTDSTTGATIENCTGATNFRVKRGPTS